MISIHRASISIGLAIIVTIGLYCQWIYVLHMVTKLAIGYDILAIGRQFYRRHHTALQLLVTVSFLFLVILINDSLYVSYISDPKLIINILIIAQLGDILQYLAGVTIGYHKIGWISPNKTYEGYIGGLLGLYVCDLYVISMSNIMIIYLLSITGSLMSSLLKRLLDIKDYSNLLGTHGGWLDRIDSLLLPVLFIT